MTDSYDDIIHLPRPISRTRPPMPVNKRAAQFAPFAALAGYEEAIKETARRTDRRIELDEYLQDALNDTLRCIAEQIEKQPEISVTYFQPDQKKDGGSYLTVLGRVEKIDAYEQVLIMQDGTAIPMPEILSIDARLSDAQEDITDRISPPNSLSP